jgi:hypothetical protein
LHPKKNTILSIQHCCHQVYCLNFYSQSFFWINPNWNSIIAKPIWLIGESIQTEQNRFVYCTCRDSCLLITKKITTTSQATWLLVLSFFLWQSSLP